MIRILIVDDMQALLEAVKYVLESNPGFHVDTAVSVSEALDFLNDYTYDIIISDYYMPEMNGIEFLKLVRSNNCNIPFILQTGQGDEKTAMEALDNGADFFLEKGSEGPLQFLAFTQIINLLVSHRRGQVHLQSDLARYKGLFDASDTGLIFIDEKGQIQDVNPSFLEMTGYSADEIQNLSYYQLIPGKWENFNPDSLREQVLDKGYSDAYALEYIHRSGRIIPITIRAVAADQDNWERGIWFLIRERTYE